MGVVPPEHSVWMDGNTQLSREPRAIALAGPIPAPLRRPPPNMYYVGEGAGEKSGGLEKKWRKKRSLAFPSYNY